MFKREGTLPFFIGVCLIISCVLFTILNYPIGLTHFDFYEPGYFFGSLIEVVMLYSFSAVGVILLFSPFKDSLDVKKNKHAVIYWFFILLPIIPIVWFMFLMRKLSTSLAVVMTTAVTGLLAIAIIIPITRFTISFVSGHWMDLGLKNPVVQPSYIYYLLVAIVSILFAYIGSWVFNPVASLFGNKKVNVDRKKMSQYLTVLLGILFIVVSGLGSLGEFNEDTKASLDAVKDSSAVYGSISLIVSFIPRKKKKTHDDVQLN
ncbi:hypothetical protein ACFQI7_32775 [Paenibacillus allorhizosphaerae]|uniref:Uncharacterized protein n=1 Tax=Paenibacillus allorhizosphaerae TaxID=2849866 RepID=A0ABM8VUG9_9BACL|nr:hypothetical protein [Paenibacillus allorhizosphaerae]CAG7658929.1 hypothetical protein PAECIP111802_07219 [Paenibacillus allorhizosphaerae]